MEGSMTSPFGFLVGVAVGRSLGVCLAKLIGFFARLIKNTPLIWDNKGRDAAQTTDTQ
jgi:hypothetical protein